MIVFIISPFMPHSTFWAYTGLPGILFTFLSGMLIQRKDVLFLVCIWFLFAILLLVFGWTKFGHLGLPTGIHINVCIGYLIALPVIFWLSSMSPKVHLDQQLGLLSFPLFLIHDPVKQFIGLYFSHSPMYVFFALSLACAFLLVLFIEKPFDKIRYKARGKNAFTQSKSL
jgi:peptidoglycan/LPS O-acetylase OafA/YrhL